jgi:hypothetical protein
MEPQTKTSAKDFFINLGAIVALYTTVVSLLNLLFTVINVAYPQITTYYYSSSQSISMPVATLIIFFPIFVLLMWLLERVYKVEPEKKHIGVRKWLTYITLFVAGLTLAGDLVTVIYYFIDGQELTTGFLLKILSVFVVILIVFLYYISDIRNKLTPVSIKVWLGISIVVILGSIIWGFSVLGSPHTQQLLKYDQQKVTDLQNINNLVGSYYQTHNGLPGSITDLACVQSSNSPSYCTDQQTKQPYEYILVGQSAKAYELCAVFNKASDNKNATTYPVYTYPSGGVTTWTHPAGHFCFTETINLNMYPKGVPVPAVY